MYALTAAKSAWSGAACGRGGRGGRGGSNGGRGSRTCGLGLRGWCMPAPNFPPSLQNLFQWFFVPALVGMPALTRAPSLVPARGRAARAIAKPPSHLLHCQSKVCVAQDVN